MGITIYPPHRVDMKMKRVGIHKAFKIGNTWHTAGLVFVKENKVMRRSGIDFFLPSPCSLHSTVVGHTAASPCGQGEP